MINYFLYILISFFIIFIISKISYYLNLVDIPNERKIHKKPVAYSGGIAISIIYLVSLQLFQNIATELNLIISIAFLIAIIGFVDDKYNLNPGGKLSLQIIPVFYLAFIENINLSHLGDYNYFKLNLYSFTSPFTLLALLFMINATNYFDGIDGSLSITSINTLFILFFLTEDPNLKVFIIIIILPIIVFLLFNFSFLKLPKMFLGDSGSFLLGFLLSFILIFYSIKNILHPIILAWSISIFVYEFLAINLKRLIQKKNPFKAGLDHLHHLLFKKTKSKFKTNFIISLLNVFLFTIGYLSFNVINPLSSLIAFVLMFFVFFYLRLKY